MFEILILSIVVFFFLIASFEDLKKREVYDYINYSFAILILIIAIFSSVYIYSYDPLIYTLFGFTLGFGLGAFLYYIGIWGGGDAKFLIGFGGASFFLINSKFLNQETSLLQNILNLFLNSTSIFVSYFANILLILNLVIILFLLFKVFSKEKKYLQNRLIILVIFLILFLGIFLKLSNSFLIGILFLVFLLIFFGKEDLFYSIFYSKNKIISDLTSGEILLENIKSGNQIIINKAKRVFGILEEDIFKIKKVDFKNEKVLVKKVIPLSIIIILNFCLFFFLILISNQNYLSIFTFLLTFLFYSFLVGGSFSILIVIFFAIKNWRTIRLNLLKIEKIILSSSFVLILLISSFKFEFLLLEVIILSFLFLKIAKSVEKLMFVKKKKLSKIVPGDWICQDILFKNKIHFKASDFKLGVSEEQLEKIKKYAKFDKTLEKILVKDGIAFIPALFIAFLIMILI